eukprot:3941981-Rhodomonas_salina.7
MSSTDFGYAATGEIATHTSPPYNRPGAKCYAPTVTVQVRGTDSLRVHTRRLLHAVQQAVVRTTVAW